MAEIKTSPVKTSKITSGEGVDEKKLEAKKVDSKRTEAKKTDSSRKVESTKKTASKKVDSKAVTPAFPATVELRTCKIDDEKRDLAVKLATAALQKKLASKEIADSLKKEFDERYGRKWHCIAGRYFACRVSYESKHYISMNVGEFVVVLFKTRVAKD